MEGDTDMQQTRAWERERMGDRPIEDDARRLLARVAAGDRPALADLYARYARPLLGYLSQLTPDHGAAEDILQETFVAVWRGAGAFKDQSAVYTWMLGIARRQAHNTLRGCALPSADVAELEDVPAADPEPEQAALAGAAREEQAATIKRLAPVHREVLALSFVHDLSYQEMSAVLGVPLGTVKSRLSNAKRALRALLAGKEEQ